MANELFETHENQYSTSETPSEQISATPGAVALKATVAANKAAKKKNRWWVTAISTVLFLAIVGAIGVTVYALWVPHPGEFGQQKIDTSDYIGTWELYKVDYHGPKEQGVSLSAEEIAVMKAYGVSIDRVVIKAGGTCKLALWGDLGEIDGTWRVDVLKENYLQALKRLPGLLRGEKGSETKVGVLALCKIPNPERDASVTFVAKKGKLISQDETPQGGIIKKYFVRSK